MATGVECVWPAGAQLGEGALWQAREGAVWFVDIKGYRVYRYLVGSGAQRVWEVPEQVGFIVPVAGGGFICGLQSGLHRFEPDSGRVTLVQRVDADRPHNRLNDGHVDHRGRLWFGTMDDAERDPTGSLYRFDRRGLVRCDS